MNPHVKQFQSYGMKLVPLNPDTKKPQTKLCKDGKYHWKPEYGVTWSDEEIERATTVGVMHKESNIIDVDLDSPEAQKFIHMLPESLTIGKKINGRPVATHKLYSYDGTCKTESYGKNTDDGCQIELLTNNQRRDVGDRIILNDVKPKKIRCKEFNNLKNIIKKIYTLDT